MTCKMFEDVENNFMRKAHPETLNPDLTQDLDEEHVASRAYAAVLDLYVHFVQVDVVSLKLNREVRY